MKKLSFLIVFIFICKINQGQNLVPNGNFENISGCPTGIGQLTNAIPWLNPSLASPDYYNQCATSSAVSVPQNVLGYQQPHSGNGYAGIFVYTQPPINMDFREYVEAQLTSPLIANSCYHFEMYISPSNESKFAIEDIDIYFSNTLITGLPVTQMPFVPQLNNAVGFISDTLNWNLISGEYYAVGGENYLTIGNFKNNANTTPITINNTAQFTGAYYYIDDVSLVLNPCSGIDEENSQVAINVFPNPATDILNVVTNNQNPAEMIIYDSASKIQMQKQFTNSASINTEHLARGIYIYEIRFKNGVTRHGKVIKD